MSPGDLAFADAVEWRGWPVVILREVGESVLVVLLEIEEQQWLSRGSLLPFLQVIARWLSTAWPLSEK